MMSSILRKDFGCVELSCGVNLNTISTNKKKWHLAFVTIYCSRALLSIKTPSSSNGGYTKIQPSPSPTLVNVKPEPGFEIEQTSFIQLTEEKNLLQLEGLGGIVGVAEALKTNTELGIHSDNEDIARRHEAFGSNTYEKPPTKSFFHFVWQALKDLTIAVLLGSAALSLGFGMRVNGAKEGWIDGLSIFVNVFLVIGVSATCNYKQYRQLDQLLKICNIQNDVVRDGRRRQISIFEIVVGDVVFLKTGDQVPANGLLLEGHSLQVDESSMTEETNHVEVNHSQNPFLLSGTKVVDGYGRMLVTSVGMNTIWGKMMSQISHDSNEQTPLQARLNKLTSWNSKVSLTVTIPAIVVLLVRYFTGNTKDECGNKEFNGSKTKFDEVVNTAVAIIRAAVTIQEGLPLAVTLTLAYSMKRMMFDNAIVRKLSACETLGSTTTICTVKTGTLTKNQMKVTDFWLGKDSIAENYYSSIDPCVVELFQEGTGLNTSGCVYRPSSEFEISGTPTEKAILSWAVLKLNMDMEKVTRNCTVLRVEAFNSQKKRSGILMKRKVDNTIWIHWKGAAEILLAMCSSYYDASGIIRDIDENEKAEFEKIIQGMAASSLRCLAFAHKQVENTEFEDSERHETIQAEGLILLGLVGIKDPCRPEVKKAIEACQSAGVNVKMITGDNVFNAKAFATECGILRPDHDMSCGVVIEGEEFRNYTPERRMEEVDQICVMARSSPFDKLLMVQCLKQKGHVVAVTGDGTHDAPALKEADIGLFMELQGTEVAKESSDIVTKDFTSVPTILRWGRGIYTNIQKFIQFQLTANFTALVINYVAAISERKVPLTAIPLLWTNLIMDTLGALALATDEPANGLMRDPPVLPKMPFITNTMWRNLLSQAFYQTLVLLVIQFWGKTIFNVNDKVKDTLIFNTFILCQIFNVFNSRKLKKKNVFKGVHRNKLFSGIIAITIVLQVLMVEFLNKFTDTERLNGAQWGACFGLAAVSWPVGWVVKCIPVSEEPVFSYLKRKALIFKQKVCM